MKLMRVPPSRSNKTSSALGGRTLSTTSAAAHRLRASAAISQPTSVYARLTNSAAAPAPDSTMTSKPKLLRRFAVSGVAATRRSPGWISFGMPIFMLREPAGPRSNPRAGPLDIMPARGVHTPREVPATAVDVTFEAA